MVPMATSACFPPTTWSSLSEDPPLLVRAKGHPSLPHPDMVLLLLEVVV